MSSNYKNIEERNKLILQNIGLAKIISLLYKKRIKKSTLYYDDIEQSAMIGLINGINKYDKSKGKLSTFLNYKIHGSILSLFRATDKLPRTTRTMVKRIEEFKRIFFSRSNRNPSDEEILSKFNISKQDLYSYLNLIELMEVSEREIEITINNNTLDKIIENEERNILNKIIEKLNNRQKLVIELYCYEDMTMLEISNIIGVTESRVSQIYKESIKKLKMLKDKEVRKMEMIKDKTRLKCGTLGCNNFRSESRKVPVCDECWDKRIQKMKKSNKEARQKTKKTKELKESIVTIDFKEDENLFNGLQDISKKQRRNIEQQILFIIDKFIKENTNESN